MRSKIPNKSSRSGGAAKPAPVRIALDDVESPSRGMSEEELAVLRELRSRMFRAECGHPLFDPRRMLGMSAREYKRWSERRRRWMQKLFANDERVIT